MSPLRRQEVEPGDWRVAADIGGTFTDLVLVDPGGRPAAVAKVLTTPDDPGDALVAGLERLLTDARVAGDRVGDLVHGTTLIANALVERRGARTALVTTAGFRDVLEIGTEARYDLYDLDLVRPEPLVPRRWRCELPERVLADGTVRTALATGDVERLAVHLREEDIESVAVVFLHSYRWPEHERQAAALLRTCCPGIDVTASADVLAQVGEFRRTSTAVANAYVRPLARRYLDRLRDRVRALAPRTRVALLSSTGLVTPFETAARVPIGLVESGPAGGVLAATAAARGAGEPDCLAFDIGGTTAKASYVVGGTPRLADVLEVARVRGFTRGSGLPLQVPTIELIEIGAGGGSVGWVDSFGLLRVGPRSAGSRPGPACYGFGGTEPTVTDADLLLGHLNPHNFLGGTMALDVGAARAALARLAGPLALEDAEGVAQALRRVVDEQMAAAARKHAVEQGLDPSRFVLVATGGAGGVHACAIARILRLRRVIVPPRAGVASAHGFLAAPQGFTVARSTPSLLAELDWEGVLELLEELEEEAAEAAGRAQHARRVEVAMRYRHQGEAVWVGIDGGAVSAGDKKLLEEGLRAEYLRRYGRVPEGVESEVLTWRIAVSGPVPAHQPLPTEAGGPTRDRRSAFFEEEGTFVDAAVVGRKDAAGEGPRIIEERESTIVVPPGARARLDRCGNVVVDL